jgi:hypothetical protein
MSATPIALTEEQAAKVREYLKQISGAQYETVSPQGVADQLEFAPYDTQPVGAGGLIYGPIEFTKYAYPSGFLAGFPKSTREALTGPAVASSMDMKKVFVVVGVLALVAAGFAFVRMK